MARHKKSKITKIKQSFFRIKKRIKEIIFEYFYLQKIAYYSPQEFFKKAVKRKKLIPNLSFFLTNLFLATLSFSLIRLITSQNHFSTAFIFFEGIIRYILWFFIILIIILAVNILAKILQGKTNLKLSANSVFFLSAPIVFLGVRFLQPIAYLYLCALLILGFKHTFKFSYLQSAFVTLIPATFFVVILLLLEFISFFPLFWLHF